MVKRRYFYLLLLMNLLMWVGCHAEGQTTKKGKEIGMKEVREPVFAGSWYPGNPEVLSRDIQRYLGDAKKEKVEGEIVALVSPHAGYTYSGQVAAYAYKLVEGMAFDSVVVVGPSHRYPFKGASLWAQGGFKTPLGVVPIDGELSKKLMEKRKEIRFIPEAHHQENSLELQIPFLQTVLTSFKLVPIAVEPDWSWETCQYLASAIAETVRGKKVLLVASTDLSHYYSYNIAVELDRIVLNQIERFDIEGLNRD